MGRKFAENLPLKVQPQGGDLLEARLETVELLRKCSIKSVAWAEIFWRCRDLRCKEVFRVATITPYHVSAGFCCGYCERTTGQVLYSGRDTRQNDWQWGRCAKCGSVSPIPRPTQAQLSKAYDTSYYGREETKFSGAVSRFIKHCRQAKAARLAKRLPSNGIVLDIGCGDGSFLSALGKIGDFELHGLELDGPAAKRAQRDPRIHLHLGDVLTADYCHEQFDLVSLFHVFEHLVEPKKSLALVYQIVKPGGWVVLSFPNCKSVQAKLFKSRWLHLDPPRHLFLPDPAYAEQEFVEAGFSIVSRCTFSIEQNPFGFIQSLLNSVIVERDVLFERLKGNENYARRHGRSSLWIQKAVAALLLGPAIILDALESACGRGATIEYILKKIR